jgi:tryptophan synthase beta chain
MEVIIRNLPDRKGYFGIYGGRFVPETLMPALKELEDAFFLSRKDKAFRHGLRKNSEEERYI